MRHAILNVHDHNREADMRYAFLSGMAARENDLAAAQERITELTAALREMELDKQAAQQWSARWKQVAKKYRSHWKVTVDHWSAVTRKHVERQKVQEAELTSARATLNTIRAALAGSQGGGGEEGQDVACTETTAPECRDGWHAIRPGEGACGCGENRMELML